MRAGFLLCADGSSAAPVKHRIVIAG